MSTMTILTFTFLLLVIIFLLISILQVGDRQARRSASLLYEIKELNHLLRAKEKL